MVPKRNFDLQVQHFSFEIQKGSLDLVAERRADLEGLMEAP